MLAATSALLVWRLAMRVAFTTNAYGWRHGCWSAPRLLVSNLVALAAAPRALSMYVAMLLGAAPRWDKTEHEFPDLAGSPA